MLEMAELSALLHAVLTGYPSRAEHLVASSPSLDDVERSQLWDALTRPTTPQGTARAVGDVLRERDADRALVNEAYRAAFYASPAWRELLDDPLFAYFCANRAGNVLDKWVHYFPIYSRHLAPFVGRSVSVLEIGVYRGGSMRMWSHYFGPHATLVGIDVDPVAVATAEGQYHVELVDQQNPDELRAVHERYGPFDVVIDDGGHTMEQQITAAETLFPLLAEGGVYIVEDCHTSYWPEYSGGRGAAGTFIEWAKQRVDDLHGYHLADPVHPVWTEQVNALHAYDSVVVLDKKRRAAPFCEQQGGSWFVFQPRHESAVAAEMLATRQAAFQERDALRDEVAQLRHLLQEGAEGASDGDVAVGRLRAELAAARDEVRVARGELGALRPDLAAAQADLHAARAEVEELHGKLAAAFDVVRAMRRTASWRLTSPLRRVRRGG